MASTDLVAVTADSHEKVVGFDITMNEVFIVDVFNTADHLHITHHMYTPTRRGVARLTRKRTSTRALASRLTSFKLKRAVEFNN